MLELDSQHELALNKVVRMRDETVAENVQLRARIVELEEQQCSKMVESSTDDLTEPRSTTPPLPEADSKTLTHNDLSNVQVLSSVEFDCLLHSDQGREQSDEHDETCASFSSELVDALRNQVQQLNDSNKRLQEQFDATTQAAGSFEREAHQRLKQLQVCCFIDLFCAHFSLTSVFFSFLFSKIMML